jgi:hypothetical protein
MLYPVSNGVVHDVTTEISYGTVWSLTLEAEVGREKAV